jgi:hypothetical protein
VLSLALSGWALAAGGSQRIHACADRKSRVLRLARKCTHGEQAVSWSVRGPTGPPGGPGPRGPGGAPGTPGASGLSSATEVYRDLGPTFSAQNASTLIVQLTNLPAGAYLLSARVGMFLPSGGSAGIVDCFLSGGNAPPDGTKAQLGLLSPGDSGLAALPLEMTTTYASNGGTAQLSCLKENSNATVVEAGGTKLIAIQLNKESHTAAS